MAIPSGPRCRVEGAEAHATALAEEPGCVRFPAGRKEPLVEQRRRYIGGVAEDDRSAEEKRFEDLGLEQFFWSFVRLERRVDDLETVLASALDALAAAETPAERRAAVEVTNQLATMRAAR